MSTTELDKTPSASETIEALEAQVGGVSYNPISWMDGGKPPISAENLQRFETGLTTIIGNSNNGKKNGLIDMITATLREEIDDRINDITKIHERIDDSEKNIGTALQTESEARSDADNNLNARINKFTLSTAPSTDRVNDHLQIIRSIEINPENSEGYVQVETGDIELEEIDIPLLHTDKIMLNDDSKTLTDKLTNLDTEDSNINARINRFQLKNPDASDTQPDDHTVYVNIQDVACDESKLPVNEDSAYINGTSVISKIYIDPQQNSEDPYVVIEKEQIDLVPVDIPMLPPNWIFGYTDKSDYNNEEHKAFTLDVRLDNIEGRINSLTTNEIHANDPNLNDEKLCEVFDSFKIEDDTVTITKAPIKLSNNDIPANISSVKIDVSEDQTLKAKLESLDQEISKLNSYVASGGMYWQTY